MCLAIWFITHTHSIISCFSGGRWELVKQKRVLLLASHHQRYIPRSQWYLLTFIFCIILLYRFGNFSTMVFVRSRWCLTRIEPNPISMRNEFSNGFWGLAWLMNPTLAEWKTPFTIRPSIDECRGKCTHKYSHRHIYIYTYYMHTNTHVYHPGNTWLPYSTRSKQLCILTANTQIIIYIIFCHYSIHYSA